MSRQGYRASQPSCVAIALVLDLGYVYVYDAHGSSSVGIPGLLEAHQEVKEDKQDEDDEEEGASNSEGKFFLLENRLALESVSR